MKTKKLLLAILTVAFSISCSSDDDTFDVSGTYTLSNMYVSSFPRDVYVEKYNLNTTISADDNCLANSNLILYPNGVAVLKLTSTVATTIQIVEGSEDDLEHVVTCEPIEKSYTFLWMDGKEDYTEPNGHSTTSSFGDFKYIRLIDGNGMVRFTGFYDYQNNLSIGSVKEHTSSVEVQGEVIEFSNLKFMTFKR